MKPQLLYKDTDYNLQQELPWNEQSLIQDLELEALFNAMALGDDFLFKVVKSVILNGISNDVTTILYRREILKDCIKNPAEIKEMYKLAISAIEKEKENFWGIFGNYPRSILSHSRHTLFMFADRLQELRTIADKHSGQFNSEGFKKFFYMLQTELTDEYLFTIRKYLKDSDFDKGILMTSELGKRNKGVRLVLNKFQEKKQSWWKQKIEDYLLYKAIKQKNKQSWLAKLFNVELTDFTFFISSYDEGGIRALSELEDQGLNLVANALAQSSDHILGFFKTLQTELAFYIACLNLYEQLLEINEPVSFATPLDINERRLKFKGLYDICLALTTKQKVVGNDLIAPKKNLFIITGANQGGKSTFLRSIGLAQLLMQSGMFVPAEEFEANICDAVFTHFKREEDCGLKSGKFDEELGRMNDIINHISFNALILFNESFAATNERDGSEIAGQIVKALIEKHIKVFFVSHIYQFANHFYIQHLNCALFLRAERRSDTTRTFKIVEGEPLQTSYGEDLYNKIFPEDIQV
ncbi:MAG: hypothetical protein FWF53_12055 [Candidatus Azobacteroides sp.]|nr:hypothetical protein [Candidatus Azobacteroides sp.]